MGNIVSLLKTKVSEIEGRSISVLEPGGHHWDENIDQSWYVNNRLHWKEQGCLYCPSTRDIETGEHSYWSKVYDQWDIQDGYTCSTCGKELNRKRFKDSDYRVTVSVKYNNGKYITTVQLVSKHYNIAECYIYGFSGIDGSFTLSYSGESKTIERDEPPEYLYCVAIPRDYEQYCASSALIYGG